MKTLVLGGTRFIGRHTVAALQTAGHQITLLNRGQTGPALFPELPRIRADRESGEGLAELRGDWDVIVDLSAYFPRTLEALLAMLRGRVGRYVHCGTLSSYTAAAGEGPFPLLDESSPLRECSAAEAVDPSMASYGQRKAECERVVGRAGIPAVVLRPCVVFGAHDPTDRLAWWFDRAAGGERFVLPEDGLTIVRRTYAPDLAQAFVKATSAPAAIGHAYNIAETNPLSFRETLLAAAPKNHDPLANAVSVSADRLLAAGVRAWSDFPLWIPRTNLLVDTYSARADLQFHSTDARLAIQTAAEAFRSERRPPSAGISRAREQELLAGWPTPAL